MTDPTIPRRRFLLGAAAASAAVLPAQGNRLRLGIIGVGKRGTAHLTRIVERPDVVVSAVCDIDPSARDLGQSAASADSPRSHGDYRDLLLEDDIEAVLIATPCHLHAEMAAAALRAGKHVYCEKPLGITADQVRTVLEAARNSPNVFQIGQQLRNSPHMQEIARQIHEEGLVGTPLVVKAQRHSTPSRPEDRSESGSGRQRRFPGWYDDVRLSGDLIVENAVHNLDVCNWLVGSRPSRVFGHGRRYLPEPMPAGTVMMDGFSVEYVYANDAHLDYSQLYLQPRAMRKLPNGQWFVVYGDRGAIEIDYGAWTFFDLHGQSEPEEHLAEEGVDLTELAHDDFLRAIRDGRPAAAGVEVAATAALTGIMGREAIYQKRMVTWEEMGVQI